MALMDVTNSSGGLKNVGDTVEGHVIGFPVGGKFNSTNILLRREDGSETTIFGSGNLKYAIADGKIVIGRYTVITKLADVVGPKTGKPRSNFKVQQDPDNVIAVDELSQALGELTVTKPLTDVTARVAALKANSSAARGKN